MSKDFLTFVQARKYVRELGLKTKREWQQYRKTKPQNIPSHPEVKYREQWLGFSDWMGYSYCRTDSAKYSINKNFFKNWTRDMAYVLGFWFADGHIRKTEFGGSIFSISQRTSDEYILERILSVMGSNHPLVRELKNNRMYSKIFLSCKTIYDDIIALGGKERKSLDCEFPNVPEEFLPDFIRGLWDGDGSVSIYKNKAGTLVSQASYSCGSPNFILKLLEVLRVNIRGFVGHIIKDKRTKTCSVLVCGPNDARKLRDFIYTGSHLFLNRKRLVFEKLGDVNRDFISYDDAKSKVRDLGIMTKREFCRWATKNKKESRIPTNIESHYKEWTNWYDFLGKKGRSACL